nr:uncharacterized protein LOC123768153 isoform X2 [Procambarus clarkii]
MGGCARLCRLLPGLLRRYWFLVVWTGACAGVFYVDYFRYKMLPQYYYTRRMLGCGLCLQLGLCVSRGSAAVLNLSCCFLVLPMCRALATTLAAALARPHRRPPALPATLPAPAAKTTHLVVAATVVISAVVHTGAHLSNAVNFSRYYSSHYPDLNLATYRGESPLRVFVATGITGAAMMIILAVLVITSTRWARRRNYDVFFYTHHLGLLFLLLLIIHPISGVLKEQKNLHGHIPGCHMYRDVHTKAEGFPEPSRAANYTNLDYNLKSQEKSRISYHVLEHNNQNQTSHTETMYPEPGPEYGYPEPDPHIGSPGPDSDYRYSEPGPEYGYPEPDLHIGSPGPDSDYHYSESDSEYGYPEPDPHIGSPGPDSDYHYSESDSEYGYPEPDLHIGSPGPDSDYHYSESDSEYGYPEPDPHIGSPGPDSDYHYSESDSEYGYPEPDLHIGSPGPDSDYRYSEPGPEYGYPEPDLHIGSPGPDSDYHYSESDSEYGYPEPDPHIGSPGPDSDYHYSESDSEYGYPEPDLHIGSPGPDSDYHYSEPDSEYGYPEPDPHIGSPGPDSDYHYSEPDSEYGYPEPDPHIGSPASESENDYIGSDLHYSFHDSDSGYSNSEVGPHNKGSASESDSGYVKANSNYDYSEHSVAHNNFKSASNMKHPSTKLHTQRFVDKETSEESGRRTATWGEIRSQKFSKKHRMCLKAPVFGSINSQTWIWVTVALAVWAADWAVRLWRRRESVHIISVVRYPCDVVQLTLRQSGFSCTPGQYVLVQCPAVSRFEWHPYTVTSPLTQHCPNTFTIFMRVRGDWSSRVAALLHPVRVSSPKSLNNHWAENEKHQCCSTSPQSSPATLSSPLIQSSQFSLSHINSLSPSFPHSNPHTNAMFSHLTQYTHAYSCMPTVDELKDCSFSPGEQKITEISYLKNQSIYPSNSKLNVKYDAHSGSNKVNLNLLNSHVPLLSANRHYKTSESRRLHPYSKYWMSQNSKSHRHSKLSNHCTSSGRTEDSCEKCMSNAEPNKQSADLQPNTRTSTFINAQPNSTLNSMKRSRSRKKWSHKSENGGLTKDKSCFSIFITEEPCVRLHVDGPFSSPSESMLHYPVVISAAGGVGITPLAATLSHILCCQSPLPERVHVVWVVRDARLFLALAPLLSSLLLHCWDAHTEDRLELRLHVTTPTPPQLLEDLFAKEHPSLLPRITQGRPVWKHLFREWQQVYIRDKVGVFACGPAKMRHQVRRHCLSSISRGAPFQYHQESFS